MKQEKTDEIIQEVRRKKERFVTEGGLIAESEMKARTPVDTGQLRGSIYSEVGEEGTSMYSDIGPSTNYAEYVEYGTVYQRAQPYAEPGWEAAVERIKRRAPKDFEV